MNFRLISFLCCLIICAQSLHANDSWLTWYELHNRNQTPSFAETIAFSKRLAEASPIVHYITFGSSHQNRELGLLVLDKDGLTDPQKIHQSGRVLLLVQANVHPGEPEGKDAGLMLIRDIAIHGQHKALLEHVTLLFIPIMSPDGHERFSPYNRINQNGPEAMGWRTNALNLNLNRDYLKLDSREIQAFTKLWNHWQPDFFIDTHATNGGDYQYSMTYAIEIFGNMEPELSGWCSRVFIPYWKEAMEADGHPVFPYVTYRNWHDPRSGLISRTAHPAFSTGYATERNRPGLLLETHMLKPYPVRVEATYLTLLHSMALLNQQHQTLKQLNARADAITASPQWRKQPFTLNYTTTHDSVMVDFKGVAYDKKQSTLSGGNWFIYDSSKPVTYQIPWFNQQKPEHQVMLPDAYIIPVQWQELIDRLQLHGIVVERLEEPMELEVERYKFEQVILANSVNEGRQTARFKVRAETKKVVFPAGSVRVSMNQPTARLIAHALEPMAPGSLAYWGFFNAVFQRTEYFESYAMETIAREMLEADPQLRKRFEEEIKGNPAYQNPMAILNWFYEQSPYSDIAHNIYPIGRYFEPKTEEKPGITPQRRRTGRQN